LSLFYYRDIILAKKNNKSNKFENFKFILTRKRFLRKISKDNDSNHVNYMEQQNKNSDVKNIIDDVNTIGSYSKSQVNTNSKDNNMEEYSQSGEEIETEDKKDFERTKKSAIEGNAEAQNK